MDDQVDEGNPVGEPEDVQEPVTPEQPAALIDGVPWAIVSGDSGVGKTKTVAATPEIFCLDTEPPGAAGAYSKDYYKAFEPDSKMFENMLAYIRQLKSKGKKVGKKLMVGNLPIAAVAIDTYDTIQTILLTRYLGAEAKLKQKRPWGFSPDDVWAPKMEQSDWGVVLNYQRPLLIALQELAIPIIWVVHAKITEPKANSWDQDSIKTNGTVSLDLSGHFERDVRNLSSVICYLMLEQKVIYKDPNKKKEIENIVGLRVLVLQKCYHNGYVFDAKDRHHIFRGKNGALLNAIPMEADEEGNPKRKIVQAIMDKYNY